MPEECGIKTASAAKAVLCKLHIFEKKSIQTGSRGGERPRLPVHPSAFCLCPPDMDEIDKAPENTAIDLYILTELGI